jgi:hypothetical protein
VTKRYNHAARLAPVEPGDDPNRRECQICGDPVTGVGDGLMHEDESVRMTTVPREYLAAVRDCTALGAVAVSRMPAGRQPSPEEIARVVAVAILEGGYLRAKKRVRANAA